MEEVRKVVEKERDDAHAIVSLFAGATIPAVSCKGSTVAVPGAGDGLVVGIGGSRLLRSSIRIEVVSTLRPGLATGLLDTLRAVASSCHGGGSSRLRSGGDDCCEDVLSIAETSPEPSVVAAALKCCGTLCGSRLESHHAYRLLRLRSQWSLDALREASSRLADLGAAKTHYDGRAVPVPKRWFEIGKDKPIEMPLSSPCWPFAGSREEAYASAWIRCESVPADEGARLLDMVSADQGNQRIFRMSIAPLGVTVTFDSMQVHAPGDLAPRRWTHVAARLVPVASNEEQSAASEEKRSKSWRRLFDSSEKPAATATATTDRATRRRTRLEVWIDGRLVGWSEQAAHKAKKEPTLVSSATLGTKMDAKVANVVVLNKAPSVASMHALALRLPDADSPSLTADARCAIDDDPLSLSILALRDDADGNPTGALVFESGALRHREWAATSLNASFSPVGGPSVLVPALASKGGAALALACCREPRFNKEFVALGGVDILRRCLASMDVRRHRQDEDFENLGLVEILDACPDARSLEIWAAHFAFYPHIWRENERIFQALATWAARRPDDFLHHVGLARYLARLTYYLPPISSHASRVTSTSDPLSLRLVETRRPVRRSRTCVCRLAAMSDITQKLCHASPILSRRQALSFARSWDDDLAVARVLDALQNGDEDDHKEVAAVLRSRFAFGGSTSVRACARLLTSSYPVNDGDKSKAAVVIRDAILATTPSLTPMAYSTFMNLADLELILSTTALAFDRLSETSRNAFYELCASKSKQIRNCCDPRVVERIFVVISAYRVEEIVLHDDNNSDSSEEEDETERPSAESVRFAALKALMMACFGHRVLDLEICRADQTEDVSLLCEILEDNRDLPPGGSSTIADSIPAIMALATKPPFSVEDDSDEDEDNDLDSSVKTPSFSDEDIDSRESSHDSFADHAVRVSGHFDDEQIAEDESSPKKADEPPPTPLAESAAKACDHLMACGTFDNDDLDEGVLDAALVIAAHVVRRRPVPSRQDAARLRGLVSKRNLADSFNAHSKSKTSARAALISLESAHAALRRCDKDSEESWRVAEILYGTLVDSASLLIARPQPILPEATLGALVEMILDGSRRLSTPTKERGARAEVDVSAVAVNTSIPRSSLPSRTTSASSETSKNGKRWLSSSALSKKRRAEAMTQVAKLAAASRAGLRRSWLSSRWLSDELASSLAAVDARADTTAWLDAAASFERASFSVRVATRQSARTIASELCERAKVIVSSAPTRTQLRSSTRRDDVEERRAERAWRACAKLLRAEWSPWYSPAPDTHNGRGGTRYRILDRVDRLGRRCLLERDHEPKDFSECAYSARQQSDSITSSIASSPRGGAKPVTTAKNGQLLGRGPGLLLRQSSSNGSAYFVLPLSSADEEDESEEGEESISMPDASSAEEVVGRFEMVSLVRLSTLLEGGTLVLSREAIRFEAKEGGAKLIFRLASIERISPRRYVLQRRAVELFRANGTSVMFALETHLKARELWGKIARLCRYHNSMPLLADAPLSFAGVYANDDPRIMVEQSQQLILQDDASLSSPVPPHLSHKTEGPPTNNQGLTASPHVEDVFSKHAGKLTDAWRKRRISNFAYLSALNELSGRTYSDVSQWPVFPWVLADFESSALDVDDAKQIRDLTRPMGALGPASRREAFIDRYNSFEDPSGFMPAFMYGSHYSSAGVVLHYLIRAQPFAELAVDLQGTHFDVPDRLFHSMKESWVSATQTMCDVKELVPELFYMPETLLNENDLPLGSRQRPLTVDSSSSASVSKKSAALLVGKVNEDELRVNDVSLPPWACGDAHSFVRANRLALEGEAVSASLHRWIDLIFGVDQRGELAERATNIFYHLTYEGAVDLDKIEDPDAKAAAFEQIKHFGQTPPQLWTTSRHPPRLPLTACQRPLFDKYINCADVRVYQASGVSAVDPGSPYGETKAAPSLSGSGSFENALRRVFAGSTVNAARSKPKHLRGAATSVTLLHSTTGSRRRAKKPPRLVAWFEDRSMALWKWSDQPDGAGGAPFSTKLIDAKRRLAKATRLSRHSASFSRVAAVVSRNDAELVVSIGYEDGRLRVHDLEKGDLLQADRGAHVDDITHLAVDDRDPRASLFVTGSKDATLTVWVAAHEPLADALMYSDDTDDDGPFFSETPDKDDERNGDDTGIVVVVVEDKGDDEEQQQRPSFVGTSTKRRILLAPSRAACLDDDCGIPAAKTMMDASGGGSRRRRASEPAVTTPVSKQLSPPAPTTKGQQQQKFVVCSHKLWGNRGPITSIAYSATLDVVVSGAQDGACCVHSARSGRFVRRIEKCCQSSVDCIELLDTTCEFVVHALETRELALLTLNAKRRATIRTTKSDDDGGSYVDIRASRDSEVFICADRDNPTLDIRASDTLALHHSIDLREHGVPRSLSMSPHDTHLFVATTCGSILILTDPKSPLDQLDAALNSTVLGSIWGETPFS